MLALAKREKYRVNVIEAFDQPWKRALEGTVGGHWGLFDDDKREAEISCRPGRSTIIRTGSGRWVPASIYCTFVFLVAVLAQRRKAVAAALDRLGGRRAVGDGRRRAARRCGRQAADRKPRCQRLDALGSLFGAAVLTPVFAARRADRGRPLPTFLELIGPVHLRDRSPLAIAARRYA